MTQQFNVVEAFEGLLERALGAPRGFDIIQECVRLAEMLVEKNIQYGDSALNPLRYHSQASPLEQIRVRMDDKLSRMARGQDAGEDPALDYVGYYILLQIAKKDAEAPDENLPHPEDGVNPFAGLEEEYATAERLVADAKARGTLFTDKSTFDKLLKGDQPSVSEIPPPPPGWSSMYGPVCQNHGCENHTGNSDRVVCPPCLKRSGMGQALDNGKPVERSSEGVIPRK